MKMVGKDSAGVANQGNPRFPRQAHHGCFPAYTRTNRSSISLMIRLSPIALSRRRSTRLSRRSALRTTSALLLTLLLALAGTACSSGAGDELQGIKKGILEIADALAINKADGDNVKRARMAAADYRRAIHLMSPASPNWTPPVLTCSALTNDGLPEIWEQIVTHRDTLAATGERQERRQRQQIGWMWSLIGDRLIDEFRDSPKVRARLEQVEASVLAGELPPAVAADQLLATFLG